MGYKSMTLTHIKIQNRTAAQTIVCKINVYSGPKLSLKILITYLYLLYVVMWRALQIEVNSSTNESKGGFPTLPLHQREAALHHRHSQYAPRTAAENSPLTKGWGKGTRKCSSPAKSTSLTVFDASRTANMADNEKLDNQRLKNFKNKGRDLEVKVVQIGVEDLLFSSARPSLCSRPASPPGFPVTSFLISTIVNFVLRASTRASTDYQI